MQYELTQSLEEVARLKEEKAALGATLRSVQDQVEEMRLAQSEACTDETTQLQAVISQLQAEKVSPPQGASFRRRFVLYQWAHGEKVKRTLSIELQREKCTTPTVP